MGRKIDCIVVQLVECKFHRHFPFIGNLVGFGNVEFHICKMQSDIQVATGVNIKIILSFEMKFHPSVISTRGHDPVKFKRTVCRAV